MKPSFLCLSLAALGLTAATLHAENAELKRMQTESQNLYKGKVDKEMESYKKGVIKAKLEFRQDLANQMALVDKAEILLLKIQPLSAAPAKVDAPAPAAGTPPAAAPGAPAPAAKPDAKPKDDEISYVIDGKKNAFTVVKKKTLEAQELAEMKGGITKMLRTENPAVEPKKDAGETTYGLRLWMKDGVVLETAFRPDCSQFVLPYPALNAPETTGADWIPAVNPGPLEAYFKKLLPSGK